MDICKAVAQETNLERLLNKILDTAMEIANCRAGTLYFREGECLAFWLVRNLDRKDLEKNGQNMPSVPVTSRKHLCSLAAIENKTISIADAYSCLEYDLSGTKAYDKRNQYHTQSVLVCPIMGQDGECLAVLQLINAVDPLGNVCDFSGTINLVDTLAVNIAMALQNVRFQSAVERLTGVSQVLETSAVSEELRKETVDYMDENYYDTCSLGELERIAKQIHMDPKVLAAKKEKLCKEIADRAQSSTAPVEVANISKDAMDSVKNMNELSKYDLLKAYMAASGLIDAEISRKTGIDKALISRIYTNKAATTKKTIFRFAMGLSLRQEQALELMQVCGRNLTHSNPLDVFIRRWLRYNDTATRSLRATDLEAIMEDYDRIEKLGNQ